MELPSLLGTLWSAFPLRPPIRKAQQKVEERHLALNEVWSANLPRGEALMVECKTGACWISCTGDAEDVFLRPGELRTWRGGGRVVVQAMAPSTHILVRMAQKARADVR